MVSRDDIGFEFMLNALRLTDGVPTSLFAERTGYPLALVSRPIETATRKGLLDLRSDACCGLPSSAAAS